MVDVKMSDLPVTNTVNGSESMAVVQGGAAKLLPFPATLDWLPLARTVTILGELAQTSSPTNTPMAAVPWSTGLTVYPGTVVRPTVDNGYLYECAMPSDWSGQGFTTGSTEPAWGTNLGCDTVEIGEGAPTWRCRQANVLQIGSGFISQEILQNGRPVRISLQSGEKRYGILFNSTQGENGLKLSLSGAPLLLTDVAVGVEIGPSAKIVQMDFHFPGAWQTGQFLMGGTGKQAVTWNMGRAHLCMIGCVADGNAADIKSAIRVHVGGNDMINPDNNGIGHVPTTARPSFIHPATFMGSMPWSDNMTAHFGDELKIISFDPSGGAGTGTAENLSVSLVFVLE